MSSTPRSTFPLETSLSESGPAPGLRIVNASPAMYSGAWTALGVKSRAIVARGFAAAGTTRWTRTRRAPARGKTERHGSWRPVTVACPGVLTDRVRLHCAGVAATARHVQHRSEDAEIASGGISGLDETLHFLDGAPADVARYVLILDTINFGSGWFGELEATTDGLTERLTAHARAERPWTAGQLRALDAAAVGATLGLPGDHQLTRLYSAALNHLGGFLGHRPIDKILGDSAEDLAERLAAGMPFFDDRGYYKRAQIAANDLHLAGVVDLSGHRPPDDLRRQPRPARAAPRRRPALLRRARPADRRGPAADRGR